MLTIIQISEWLHHFYKFNLDKCNFSNLKKSVLNSSRNGLRKPFNLQVWKVMRVEEGVFATQSRILVQTLCKAGHAHKIKDIYCKNNKPNGCPSVCKDLRMLPGLKHTFPGAQAGFTFTWGKIRYQQRAEQSSSPWHLAHLTLLLLLNWFRYIWSSAAWAWCGMTPATVHAGCIKELTVETITVLTVKFTVKLVFKTEWNDFVDQSLHTSSLIWSLMTFFSWSFVYSYSTTNLATSHINPHQQILPISF